MRRMPTLVRSLVGQKVIMAVSGLVLILFVIGHLLGNLKVFLGPEKFNAYAEGLRTFGEPFLGRGDALLVVRLALLLALALHLWAALSVSRASLAARPIAYRRLQPVHTSVAAGTMRVGGILLLAYVVYHLLDLTFGTVNPGFVPGDAYANLVRTFQRIHVAAGYIAAMAVLGLHLHHGTWSALQTLGLLTPPTERVRRGLAAWFAAAIVAGYVSIPLAVLAGILQ